MRYSIIFVIVLVLVSGFIAYFGDLLGRKMGKKRLSVFRLRPRYTAIVVTTITGMVISALVLATLLAGDKSFREAFTQWETVTSQNKRLAIESKNFEVRNKALQVRSIQLEKEADRLQKEADKARKTAVEAKKARNAAVEVVSRLKKEIIERKQELDALRKKSNATQSELAAKAKQLNEVQKHLQIARNNLKAKQTELTSVQARLAAIGAQLIQTRVQLAEAEETLKQQELEIDQQRSTLSEQKKLLVELGKRYLNFQQETMELRNSELKFRQGDELGRGVISPRQSTLGIKGDLLSLLENLSQKAEKAGAKVGDNERAIQLIFLLDAQSYIGERECIDMAASTIASGRLQNADALVQIVCARNTVEGEQVPVELHLYLNNLVYPKGKFITRSKIDGRQSEGRILLSVISFLQTDVSRSALRAGIIPISNPDPRITAGVDPGTQVEGLMAVVDKIKAENTTVKLDVYATDDIYAADPINMNNIRFNVTRAD
ncbi:DUF3084 domain-containing protein [bacterium]|nr:DUF3084 domain-containing protein [bacterium]